MKYAREARGRRELGARRARRYLVATLALLAGAASLGVPSAASANPFVGRGMWIWYVNASNGGNLSSIVGTAHAYGIKTLLIKSGDGSGAWSQFSPQLVASLHANGLRVCGWQYVYGDHPVSEAYVGANAVQAGADCLVIDAEGEYEGKYVQAQTYLHRLRKLIGAHFPVGLAGFPYIDFHPGFPYSVFLGPGGAQYNLPQMYWFDIGTTVDAVYAHTFAFNRIYRRSIYPLGELTGPPPQHQIVRFRELSLAYGTSGLSWWVWQDATPGGWQALNQPIASLANFTPYAGLASLGKGALGDVVVWAQEHLVTAGWRVAVDGSFGPKTMHAVQRFQSAHGLNATGLIDTTTWQVLLRYRPAHVHWTLKRQANTASASSGLTSVVPKNASVRGRDEFRGARALGAGGKGPGT